MCSYVRMFTVRHILIAWRMLRKGCYGNSNVLAFSIMGRTKTIRISVPRLDAIFFFFLKTQKKKSPFSKISGYVWTASLLFAQGLHYDYWNGVHLEEDYPITTVFENNRFSSFFCKRTNNIQEKEGCFLRGQVGSDGFKLFNDYTVEHWILLLRFKKTLRIYNFQKTVWLDNLLTSAPVRVVAL